MCQGRMILRFSLPFWTEKLHFQLIRKTGKHRVDYRIRTASPHRFTISNVTLRKHSDKTHPNHKKNQQKLSYSSINLYHHSTAKTTPFNQDLEIIITNKSNYQKRETGLPIIRSGIAILPMLNSKKFFLDCHTHRNSQFKTYEKAVYHFIFSTRKIAVTKMGIIDKLLLSFRAAFYHSIPTAYATLFGEKNENMNKWWLIKHSYRPYDWF